LQIPIVEADDICLAVEALTNPEAQPELHYWNVNPEATEQLSVEEILQRHIEVCQNLEPAIAAVIENHIETRMPIVLEGDYILPGLVARYAQHVSAVFVIEDEIEQIVKNYQSREPEAGRQQKRAEVSHLFGQWLSAQIESLNGQGSRLISSRPWETVLERTLNNFPGTGAA